MLVGLAVIALALPAQTPDTPATACLGGLSPSALEMCLGEQDVTRGDAAAAGTAVRRRHFEAAAAHYRRAAELTTEEPKVTALTRLADVYDARRLDEPAQRETVLRELVALTPSEPRFAFELAAHQEAQAAHDAAEQTLLTARQQHPTNLDTFKRLAQFYARRVTAMQPPAREQIAADNARTGGLGQDGVLEIGGAFKPPPRLDVPQFPAEAQAAGIEGMVRVALLIDPEGSVADAQVVRSIPLLDEPALKAVREWRFQPTLVNGQAVPVRMTVNVQFTLSK
jgi:TonB family protein